MIVRVPRGSARRTIQNDTLERARVPIPPDDVAHIRALRWSIKRTERDTARSRVSALALDDDEALAQQLCLILYGGEAT